VPEPSGAEFQMLTDDLSTALENLQKHQQEIKMKVKAKAKKTNREQTKQKTKELQETI